MILFTLLLSFLATHAVNNSGIEITETGTIIKKDNMS